MAAHRTVVICDDESVVRWPIKKRLSTRGFDVHEARDGEECLKRVREVRPDLLISDLRMPRMDGLELLRQLRAEGNDLPVLMISAHGDIQATLEASSLGAKGFITKPLNIQQLDQAVSKLIETAEQERQVHPVQAARADGYGLILGSSPEMQEFFRTLRQLEEVAPSMILVIGETGTGKDLVARAIHERGPRRGPYVEVNCAALPEALFESELFGHARGAFTDAKADHPGLFEEARSGTVFLDEIGELSAGIQAKLLRALENRTFRRVGESRTRKLDAGIIAATHKDLALAVGAGRFREDLYYRLNVIRVEVPPLRQRRADIPVLTEHFISDLSQRYGRRIEGVTEQAMELLCAYPWPGNVRELRNVIERIVVLRGPALLEASHLPGIIRYGLDPALAGKAPFILPEGGVDLESVDRSLVLQALTRTGGNQTEAAKLLGLNRYAVRYRLKKYNIKLD
jgi:two-component system response regulator AtoC